MASMTVFDARWVPIPRRGARARLGLADPLAATHRAVCGVPAGCPGVLGTWNPLLPARLAAEDRPWPGPVSYYIKDGDNRYRLPSGRQRAPGWRRPGSRKDPHPVLTGTPGPIIRGRKPTIPTVIVCPVCGRDNAIAIAPTSH
jgi:hypothetical protein